MCKTTKSRAYRVICQNPQEALKEECLRGPAFTVVARLLSRWLNILGRTQGLRQMQTKTTCEGIQSNDQKDVDRITFHIS